MYEMISITKNDHIEIHSVTETYLLNPFTKCKFVLASNKTLNIYNLLIISQVYSQTLHINFKEYEYM